jgi:hypothetical protein
MWFYLITGGFLVAIGLAVHAFKMHFLIAGYNTMSADRRKNVDIRGLARMMGICMYLCGGAFAATGILDALGVRIGMFPALALLIVSVLFMAIRAQKYDPSQYDESGKLRREAVAQIAVPATIVVSVLILVAVLFIGSSRPTRATLQDEGLRIHGMYGRLYPWDSLGDIRLIDELPSIERRVNGSGLGANLKGHFRTTQYGVVMLFVNAEAPPFVLFESDGGIVIFNTGSADETRAVYKEILARR